LKTGSVNILCLASEAVPSTVYDAKGLLPYRIMGSSYFHVEQMVGDKGEVPDGEYIIPLELLDVKREEPCNHCFI
jgi:pyruvate/2-oxoglutarate/acetoin dehydrogenase E1 component